MDTDTKSDLQPPVSALPAASPVFDRAEYRAELADMGLTGEQESELLQTLWSIMGHFARVGFAVDVCGLIFEEFNESAGSIPADDKLIASTYEEMPATERCEGGSE